MISFFSKNKGRLAICEDSLTASIFDLLKYLPAELFWNILKKSLYQDKLPDHSGEILELLFWERWSPKHTNNIRFVEPDIFIRYRAFDIIIEAKRYDEFQQNDNQLITQIASYYNEFGEEGKNVYYIQLGGLHHKDNVEDKKYKDKLIIICKTDWSRILNQVSKERRAIDHIEITSITPYKRILDDIIRGFELHQYFKKTWLENLNNRNRIHFKITESLFNYANRNKGNIN
ncbi:hypothetical protein FOE74_09820 [Rufibacter glacialis]|nr:hypothetical protein FOE74_09820 [Rufibacter glacialis]